jgi:hypothetical protein
MGLIGLGNNPPPKLLVNPLSKPQWEPPQKDIKKWITEK